MNFFFPQKCGLCGKILDDNLYICKSCYYQINNYKIDLKIDSNTFVIYNYDSIVRKYILEYKFFDKSYLYKTFTTCILFDKKVCNFINDYDIISPISLHYRRFLERGYNQTALIAKNISKQMNIQDLELLKKIKNIKPQPTKTIEQRINDVKGVYKLKSNIDINNKTILIFDDIITTGATSLECKNELERNGASKVGILVLARGIDK